MTEIQPPHYLQEGCHTAQGDRQVMSSLVCGEGVAFGANAGGNLEVVDGPAGMQVTVSSGNAFIQGDDAVWQGMYHVTNDANVNITLAASDPTNPRIDLIVAVVHDNTYSVPGDDWALEAVTGTPAGSPSPPATPDSAIVLAQVEVAGGAVAITASDITDTRSPYTLCGGGGEDANELVVFTSSTTFIKSDYPGMRGVRVRGVGGGGAGGGSEGPGVGESSGGAGGGSGSYFEVYVPEASLSPGVVVGIGLGGVGVLGGTGSGGGTSSFGSYATAPGGDGGNVMGADSVADVIPGTGNGNGGGTGDFVSTGRDGGGVIRVSGLQIITGKGGDSVLGKGGMQLADDNGAAGNPGSYGGGGSGAISRGDSEGPHSGGAGGDGVVIVEIL